MNNKKIIIKSIELVHKNQICYFCIFHENSFTYKMFVLSLHNFFFHSFKDEIHFLIIRITIFTPFLSFNSTNSVNNYYSLIKIKHDIFFLQKIHRQYRIHDYKRVTMFHL